MPALIESEHPRCAHLIHMYKKCSTEASLFSKIFFGECTALKYQLDACFKQEKVAKSKAGLAQSKIVREKTKALRAARNAAFAKAESTP